MSDHRSFRGSSAGYYKDSYGSSKRHHSPASYFDGTSNKRTRGDSFGDSAHTSSSVRYVDYHVSGSSSSTAPYKKSSSSTRYYDEDIPMKSSSSFRRDDDASYGSSRKCDDYKSPVTKSIVRRIPPAPPMAKSSRYSMSSSNRDSYSSRMRQAPPENSSFRGGFKDFRKPYNGGGGSRFQRGGGPLHMGRSLAMRRQHFDRPRNFRYDNRPDRRDFRRHYDRNDRKDDKRSKSRSPRSRSREKSVRKTENWENEKDIKTVDQVGADDDKDEKKVVDGEKEKVDDETTDEKGDNVTSTKDDEEKEEDKGPRNLSNLLKLRCHYCDVKCSNFREFTNHVRSFSHTKALDSAIQSMRRTLSSYRIEQRDTQRELEKEHKTLSDTTVYCRVCNLDLRTDPVEHEANELHNKIKTLIYKRCDVCDVNFRIWKVYLHHMAALEHVERVAMKELEEAEKLKGSKFSDEELGLDLVEKRNVLYCVPCARYVPIREDDEEACRMKHCLSLTHIKYVDEHREKQKRYEERKREPEKEKEKEKQKEKESEQKTEDVSTNQENNADTTQVKVEDAEDGNENVEVVDKTSDENVKDESMEEKTQSMDTTEENVKDDEESDENNEVDQDEIDIHADADDDISEEPEKPIRRSSRRRGSGKSN